MIPGLLELLFGKDDMKIVSIHIGVFIYMSAVRNKCKSDKIEVKPITEVYACMKTHVIIQKFL
jgi:tetrahydromethanopterin S-methyltransferase subunit D